MIIYVGVRSDVTWKVVIVEVVLDEIEYTVGGREEPSVLAQMAESSSYSFLGHCNSMQL